MQRLLTLALVTCSVAFSACVGTRKLADPTVQIETGGGRELGVSTEFGVIFLGRTARSGYVEITAWFGDGPSIESSVIEPIGGDLYTAETEIRIPSVPMTFFIPKAGESLLVRGRTEDGAWEQMVRVRSDPRVYGILLEIPAQIGERADQIGAGVYDLPDGDRARKRLIGLVSGKLRLKSDGVEREFLTVVGPDDLWRLVTHRRDMNRRKPWVYREDIL